MFNPENDADWDMLDLQNAAKDAANGVCSICDEALYPLDPKWADSYSDRYPAEKAAEHVGPVCPDLPYHVRCLEGERW